MISNQFAFLFTLVSLPAAAQPLVTNIRVTPYLLANYSITLSKEMAATLLTAADSGRLQAYDDPALTKKLTRKEVQKRRTKTVTVKILYDPNNPKATRDSLVTFTDPPENYTDFRMMTADGRPLAYCMLGSNYTPTGERILPAAPLVWFSYADMLKQLDKPAQAWLRLLTAQIVNKPGQPATIDRKALIRLAHSTIRQWDSTLFHISRQATVPVFFSDSFTRQMSAKNLREILDYEVIIQMQTDPNDPYADTDSAIYVNYVWNPADSLPVYLRLVWQPEDNGVLLKLKAVSAMFNPYAGGLAVPPQPLAFMKPEDAATALSADALQVLQSVGLHALLLRGAERWLDCADEELKPYLVPQRYMGR